MFTHLKLWVAVEDQLTGNGLICRILQVYHQHLCHFYEKFSIFATVRNQGRGLLV